ncbi:MAG: DUF4832 domain-containing protein [Chloroflexota bacterium]
MHPHRFYRVTAFLIAIALCVPLVLQLPQASAAQTQTVTYEQSEALFPNPERGWFHSLTPNYALDEQAPPLTLDQLATYRAENVTVVRKMYLLKDFRNTPITTEYLTALEADFNTVRQAGVKLVPRFVYVWKPDPGTWPTNNTPGNNQQYTPDASPEMVNQHLDQLALVLQEHEDVLAYVEAGLVGYWGEWHDSHYGYVDNWTLTIQDSGYQVLNQLLETVPSSRMVLMRYPWHHHMALYPNALSVETAYIGGDQARLGFHDDGFQSEEDGWYHYEEVEQQKAYTQQSTAYTVMSGEPGVWYEEYGATADPLVQIEALHYSTLNRNAEDSTEFYLNWAERGLLDDMSRALGYRYHLKQATVPTQAQEGDTLVVSLKMVNTGAARPYNPRDLEVVLRHTDTDTVVRLPVEPAQDMRLFLPGPGETKDLSLSATLPEDIASGDYEVLLNLPDPAVTLNDRPEYSIRLANQNMWEVETGYNKLNATLEVEGGTLDVPSVTSFTLINADTDEALQEVQDGETLDLSTLNTANLNIRANTEPVTVGSVQFLLNDKLVQTENYVPYAIAGDTNQGQDYLPWEFPAAGQLTLTAIPYSNANGSGIPGQELTINLSLVQSEATRDPWLWPFAQDSIWNTPIGSDAVYAPANFEPNATLGGDDVYLLQLDSGDPARPVYGHDSWGPGRCTGSGLGFDWNIPDNFIVPDAEDTWTPNNPFAFLLPDSNTVFEAQVLARCESDGPIYIPSWIMLGDNPQTALRDIYGDGIDGQSERYGGFGHGASGMSALGGTIRTGELTNDTPIRHPIKLTMWAHKYLYYNEADATPGYRWPATGADAYAGDPEHPNRYEGTNPDVEMGTLLAIPPDVTAEDIGLQTDAAKKLFAAMQDYGAYIVEDSAWDNTLLVWEKGVEEELNAIGINPSAKDDPFFQDVNTLFQSLYIVTNNGPNNIGGGGTPRAPLAPPFANP